MNAGGQKDKRWRTSMNEFCFGSGRKLDGHGVCDLGPQMMLPCELRPQTRLRTDARFRSTALDKASDDTNLFELAMEMCTWSEDVGAEMKAFDPPE